MTVQELMEKLDKYPPHAEVRIYDTAGGYFDVTRTIARLDENGCTFVEVD